MKTLFIFAFAVIMSSSASFAQPKTWKTDSAHSAVKFNVTHLVISEVEGNFTSFTGNIISENADFTDAKIDFSVDVNSINTDNEMRDGHLKSDDFFNAEKFPTMTFKSVSMKKIKGSKYELTGDLTIRNTTKRVTFDVNHGGVIKDGYGNIKAGFKAKTSINRFDYGLNWNMLTEGVATVSDEVEIILNLQFAQQQLSTSK
jgi:polyisoprenoid-binding protein YceI